MIFVYLYILYLGLPKSCFIYIGNSAVFSTFRFIPVLEVSLGDKKECGSAPQISSLSSLNLTLGEASKNAKDRDKYQQEIVFRVWDEAEPKASQAEEF